MSDPEHIEHLLTPVEVGEILGISRTGVYRLRKARTLATIKIGEGPNGRIGIEPAAVRRFIASRRRTGRGWDPKPEKFAAAEPTAAGNENGARRAAASRPAAQRPIGAVG